MAKKAKSAPEPTPDPKPAEYTVVARRYRPQQFADLIGQEHVAQALTNAITSGRIAHAYLFTGARGVGKTSAARILAKALNCVTGPTPTPCDQCEICLGIAAGEDVDALEIDGASNNKVDEIRELRVNSGFRPARARYKIYIIDEVHMLSGGAFNALLKTLEEPPAHVKFILATTEVQKIPITILSRCQRFDFAQVTTQRIFDSLRHIVGKEGLQADDDSLYLVAKRAAGSMRDSQSLLDQLLAFSDGPLTAAKVHDLLGTAGEDRVAELAGHILTGDAKAAVETLADCDSRGLQLGELLDQLIDYWRGMMLVLSAGPDYPHLPGTPNSRVMMAKHAATTTLDTVLAGLDVLTTAKGKSRGNPHVAVLVEMAVVRLARLDQLMSVAELARVVSTPGATLPPAPDGSKKKLTAAPEPVRPAGPAATSSVIPLTSTSAAEVWGRVLDAVGGMTRTSLEKAELPAIVGPNSLVVRFSSSYSSAYDYCSSERVIGLTRAAIQKVTGSDWAVRVEHLAETVKTGPKGQTRPAPMSRKKELLEQSVTFRTVAEKLGGQLVTEVDADFGRPAAGELPVVPPGATPDIDDG